MNSELDPSEVGARLHGEFALLTEPPPPLTTGVVRLGRRRRRNRLLTSGLAFALVAATAVTVPVVLRPDSRREPTPAVAKLELTWTWEGRLSEGMSLKDRRDGVLPAPGDRREWVGWLTDKKLRDAFRAALREIAPDLRVDDEVSIGRLGGFMESGATAVVPVTSADGRKGGVEAGIFGKAGGAAVLAEQLARTGKRESYLAGPRQVAANVRRERRTLAGGLEAVVYPQGAGFWQLPVDAFTTHGTQVVATTYIESPPNSTQAQFDAPLTPARALLSPDQLLKIVERLGKLRSDQPIPPAPGKVVKACDTLPPTGWPAITAERANAAARAAVQEVLPGVKVQNPAEGSPIGEACWDSASARRLNGEVAGGFYRGGLQFSGSRNGALSLSIALRTGQPVDRATRLARNGSRSAAGLYSAPIEVGPAFPKDVRSLPGGTSAVVYPQGAGPLSFESFPVDVFAPGGLNIGLNVRKIDSNSERRNVLPAEAVLTIDELLRIGQAIATALR